jgi:hypothetical protein
MGEIFQLPLGVVHNGDVSRDVVLKPMTAKTRRLMAAKSTQKNPSAGLTNLLGQCCESIANAPPSPQMINSLTIGDRDFMLLMLRKMSVGDILKAEMSCPRCQEQISFDLPIDDIRINVLEKDKDYVIEGTNAFTTLKNDELGTEVMLRFPTGFDQSTISQQAKTDPVGASYALYVRLIKSWFVNGEPVENPNTMDFIDDLPLKEIEWLENAFRKAMPGPDWMVNLTCELCSKETLLDLSDTDFLFRTPR